MIKKAIKTLYCTLYSRISPVAYARKIGVTVGQDCELLNVVSYGSEPWLITIGNHVRLAGGRGVAFITHEGAHWVLKGLDKEKYKDIIGYGRITIKDNVFIGSGTTILRGVTIGENVVVGACSLVNKSLAPNAVYAGVPAKRICSLEEWEAKVMEDVPEYDLENYNRNKKDEVLRIIDKFKKR